MTHNHNEDIHHYEQHSIDSAVLFHTNSHIILDPEGGTQNATLVVLVVIS